MDCVSAECLPVGSNATTTHALPLILISELAECGVYQRSDMSLGKERPRLGTLRVGISASKLLQDAGRRACMFVCLCP